MTQIVPTIPNPIVDFDFNLKIDPGLTWVSNMAIRVVEFSKGGYKIRKVFAYESTSSKEIIEF